MDMEDDEDIFEAYPTSGPPGSSGGSRGSQIEIFEEEEVELCIYDEFESNQADERPVDLAAPPPKRRKIESEPANRIPTSTNNASSNKTQQNRAVKEVAKPSVAAVAAASVSSFGLRSFFKALAPGESIGSSLAAQQKPPPTQPKPGAEPQTPLQKQIFDAISSLGPMKVVHLLALLFAQTKDLDGQQRLAFKVHYLWGKCISKLHPRTPQEVNIALNWLIENGFIIRDSAADGCLRCWNQSAQERNEPSKVPLSSSRAPNESRSEVKESNVKKIRVKEEPQTDQDDILTQYAAIASHEDPPRPAASSGPVAMKPWLSGERKPIKKVKNEDPGAKAAVKIVDPFAQPNPFPSSGPSQTSGISSTNLSSFSSRKVSSSGASGGFLSGGALSPAAPLTPQAQQALSQSSFGAAYARKDILESHGPSVLPQAAQDVGQSEIAQLRTFLPLARTQPATHSINSSAPLSRSVPHSSAAQAQSGPRSSSALFGSSSAAVAPLALRPSVPMSRSYSGGLSDSLPPLDRSYGRQTPTNEKRAVTAALPRVERVQSRQNSFKNDITDRASRNSAIIGSLRLSEEQKQIVQTALEGRSFFFTGAAGTGKSYVLRELVRVLKEVNDPGTVFVTAPTGVAACNVAGSTIHSFSGIGLGKGSAEQIVARILKNRNACVRWHEAKVLVIDEISMLSGELFENLEAAARKVRKNNAPFGGIQLIACGDFFQLPPVRDGDGAIDYCFQAEAWKRVVTQTFVLRQVWRQKDNEFIEILSEIREGRLSEKHRSKLNECVGRQFATQITPTRLFARREDVAATNERELTALSGLSCVYKAFDTEKYPNSQFLTALQENCPAPTVLTLKLNAQVILLKNLSVEDELVNGSRGVVVGFDNNDDPKDPLLPRVLFDNGKTRTIGRTRYSTVIGQDEMCAREMLPLNLAWAMSIHKAQGMTISRLEIDVKRIWEDGQAYVALSRATSLDGLRLLNPVEPRIIRANPEVIEFYKSLGN